MTHDTPENAPKGRICPECGETFSSNHPTKRFCTPAHKQAYANREAAQGKVIASLVKAWRQGRGSDGVSKAAFALLCPIVDAFNAEDREAGRPPASVYVKAHLRDGFQYQDRARRKVQPTI